MLWCRHLSAGVVEVVVLGLLVVFVVLRRNWYRSCVGVCVDHGDAVAGRQWVCRGSSFSGGSGFRRWWRLY